MYKIKLIKDGEPIATKPSDTADASVFQKHFDRAEDGVFLGCHDARDAIINEAGEEIQPAREKNYSIEIEDISQELADKAEKEAAREASRNDLKAVKKLVQDAKNANNEQQLKRVVQDLAKAVLQISKVLGLADPKDSEELQ